METLSTSIPFGVKSIWYATYFEKEIFMVSAFALCCIIYAIYQAWRKQERKELENISPTNTGHWKALYKELDETSNHFPEAVEALLTAYAREALGIVLTHSQTAEEKIQLLSIPEIARCLTLIREIRYSDQRSDPAKIRKLSELVEHIFESAFISTQQKLP